MDTVDGKSIIEAPEVPWSIGDTVNVQPILANYEGYCRYSIDFWDMSTVVIQSITELPYPSSLTYRTCSGLKGRSTAGSGIGEGTSRVYCRGYSMHSTSPAPWPIHSCPFHLVLPRLCLHSPFSTLLLCHYCKVSLFPSHSLFSSCPLSTTQSIRDSEVE